MNVTTLPGDRQRRVPQGAARSGGRTTQRDDDALHEDRAETQFTDYGAVAGATALQPQRRPGEAEPPVPPRLRVAPPAPVIAPRAPFVALVLVLVITGVIGILVLNTKIAENAFRLHDLRQEQGSLDRQQQRLERELARKASPGELAAAGARNGLVPSRTPAYIVLPDGRQIGVPGPGAPAGSGQSRG